jgi:hypothetical protein
VGCNDCFVLLVDGAFSDVPCLSYLISSLIMSLSII